jgi:hypothetical protein
MLQHTEKSRRGFIPHLLSNPVISQAMMTQYPSILRWCRQFFLSCNCGLSHWRILHHCCTFSCSFLHSPRNLRHIPAAELVPPASSPSSPSPSPSSSVTWNRIRSCPAEQKECFQVANCMLPHVNNRRYTKVYCCNLIRTRTF